MKFKETISVARGQEAADIVLKNARYLNVFTDTFDQGDIALKNGYIVGVPEKYDGKREIDLHGQVVVPGFIDAHIHIESSMLTVPRLSEVILPLGTTSIVVDPHEIANVLGSEGISYILKSSKYQKINVYVLLPSCVPATPWETSGAELDSVDLLPFLENPWVLGLAEMMNYPGVLMQDAEVINKIKIAQGKILDGHCPQLRGRDLNAYLAMHITSDHESTAVDEAREKLSKGMHLFIREGTTSRNLKDLLPVVNEATYHHCSFCSDDRDPETLLNEGHMNSIIATAIQEGIPPAHAYKMASYNTARYYHLRELGAVAPGYQADLTVIPDEKNPSPSLVIKNGEVIFEEGRLLISPEINRTTVPVRGTMNVRWLKQKDFEITAHSKQARIIEIVPEQIITRQVIEEVPVKDGLAESDPARDILKLMVVERHNASGRIGKGLVRGLGLQSGALASSVAHDSHNLIVVGVKAQDMLAAAVEVIKMQGGMCVVNNEKVLSACPLPIAGLMSQEEAPVVADRLHEAVCAAYQLGCKAKHPFLVLAFLSLPVIPELKLTDKGLFDVNTFEFCDLFIGS